MRRAILVFVCAIGLLGLGATASAGPLQSEGNTLTVKIDGKGNVRSNPPGIDCPGDCQSDFDSEETVVLTAKPAQGWVFDHWRTAARATARSELQRLPTTPPARSSWTGRSR